MTRAMNRAMNAKSARGVAALQRPLYLTEARVVLAALGAQCVQLLVRELLHLRVDGQFQVGAVRLLAGDHIAPVGR